MGGIYKITNNVNNKVYTGRTLRDFKNRWEEHTKQLNNNIHVNLELQKDWNKYGTNNFNFSIIEDIVDNKEIPLREYYHISQCDKNKCYNEIYRKAQNTLKAIGLLLKDSDLKVYLECSVDGIIWSMVVKDLKENKIYYFIQNLKNKKNIEERESFIYQSNRRILIDIPKPIRNYHNDSSILYKIIKER